MKKPAPNPQALSLQRLREAGGRRISINLTPAIAAAIDRVVERDHVTQSSVILQALRRVK